MTESRLDPFLKSVDDVILLRCAQENEADLTGGHQGVQDLVQHDLLGRLYIVVNVFENEENFEVLLVCEVFLDFFHHLDRGELIAARA